MSDTLVSCRCSLNRLKILGDSAHIYNITTSLLTDYYEHNEYVGEKQEVCHLSTLVVGGKLGQS